MSGILQIPVSTAGATLVWAARSDTTVNTLLLINQDLNNTVYIGQDQSITAGGQNVIPLAPNGSLSVDPNSAWYVIGAVQGIAPLVMVPNGQATFRNLTQGEGSLALPSIHSPGFQLNPLTGWSVDQDGNAYFKTVSVGNNVSGALNPNPYFNGKDISGWVPNNGNGTVTGVSDAVLPANAPYKYALKYTGSSSAIESGGRFPVTAGNQYQFSPWVNTSDNSAQNAFYGFAWYNAAGMWISDSVVSSSVPVNTWSQVSTVQTAPAGAVSGAPKAGPNNGTMFIQAAIVSPQIPGTLIQPGTITAAQLITGLVVAGIVDATTITGATFVADGTAGEILVYSGPPALGNLILSVAASAGVDKFGNAYYAGITAMGGGSTIQLAANASNIVALLITLGSAIHTTTDMQIFGTLSSGGAANELMQMTITSGKESLKDDAAIQLFSEAADASFPAEARIEFGGTIVLNASKTEIDVYVPIVADQWHNITLDAGWVAGPQPPQYRMLPDGNVQVRGNATIAGTTAAVNINSANPLVAAYRPQQTRFYRPPIAQDAAGTVQMGTNGILAMRASGFTATQAILDGTYSL